MKFYPFMYSKKTLESADQFAQDYESYIIQRSWSGPERLFNLVKPFIHSGDRLLDLGIGTGLSSERFHKAGLIVDGVDGSDKMLRECRKKNITNHLYKCDLANPEISALSSAYHLIISFALFHMIFDLKPVFQFIAKTLEPQGYFAFSVIRLDPERDEGFKQSAIPGIFERKNDESGIMNFRHETDYINNLLLNTGFDVLHEVSFQGFNDLSENRQIIFTIYVTRLC
jgi:predicted TPR repeat methyltransferase